MCNGYGTDHGEFAGTHGSNDRGGRSSFRDLGIITIRPNRVATVSDAEWQEQHSFTQNDSIPPPVGLASITSIVPVTDLVVFAAEADRAVQATEISVGRNEELGGAIPSSFQLGVTFYVNGPYHRRSGPCQSVP